MENKIKDRITDAWQSITHTAEEGEISALDREKVIVFAVCIILAFCLWMIVNLNRDYNIDIKVPVELGNITTNRALVNELPQNVTASISGDGWNLINMYNNPPHVYIDVSSDEVNIFEQVRQQISSASNLTVQKVNPLYLQVKLEEKKSKKVPIKPNVNVKMAKQYGALDSARLTPDSVVIRGAESHISTIDSWPTDSLTLNNVNEGFTTSLNLKKPSSLVTLSTKKVSYHLDVAQFTEGEVTVPVNTRDFPIGHVVNFSPPSVNIRYRIPLKEYAKFSNGHSFTAFVTYDQIQQDTTGFVAPQVEKIQEKAHLTVKSVQPRQVGYFTIVDN